MPMWIMGSLGWKILLSNLLKYSPWKVTKYSFHPMSFAGRYVCHSLGNKRKTSPLVNFFFGTVAGLKCTSPFCNID